MGDAAGVNLATLVRAYRTMKRLCLAMLIAVAAMASAPPVAASSSPAAFDSLAIKSLSSPALQSFT